MFFVNMTCDVRYMSFSYLEVYIVRWEEWKWFLV